MIAKEFVQADQLVRDAFELARRIFDSGFRPDAMLVLWRGGTPVGICIHEFFLFLGIPTFHLAVKAESYTAIGEHAEPRLENLDSFLQGIRGNSAVLVVDDIFDSGRTLHCLLRRLEPVTRNVRTATLYYKPGSAQVDLKPDYYLRTTDRWVVFPHELMGLTPDEILRKDPGLRRIIPLQTTVQEPRATPRRSAGG